MEQLAGCELVADAFEAQLALELGERQRDVRQHPAHSTGGVDCWVIDTEVTHCRSMMTWSLETLWLAQRGPAADFFTQPLRWFGEERKSKAKTRNPCGMQGSSGPQSAVITVGLARVRDVSSKLTKGRYRSVA